MKSPAALAALTVALATTVTPASARSSYVVDDAHLLSPTAISQINQQVGDFNAQTRKEVVVVTTPTLGGVAPDAAIERSFAQQQVNGVEIFVAKNEHEIRIAGTTAASRYFPAGSYQTIARTMRASFKTGDYDGGVENAVSTIINTYRGHEGSLNGNRRPAGAVASPSRTSETGGGFNMGWIWWIIILAVIFFVIRGIFRALSGPRMMGGPGYGPGPGYGGGYGPGYGPGYGGGGGGFWSGLLGGLGGAWLGNELFGGRRDIGDGGGYASGGFDPGQQADAGGWQDQPGQIDTSNIGGSSWGDSGGGDSGGGWGGGDSGGGDSGGGGGDGGW